MENELLIRLGVFFGCLLLFAVLENLFPRRQLHYRKGARWASNLGISVINSIAMQLLLPLAGVAAALLAAEQRWGLFNQFNWSDWLTIPLYLLLFDLVIYWQHRLFHLIPLCWRLHRMHHTDPDYDLSTGVRFHPLEILLSALIKIVLIIVLGPPLLAVILSELILNASSLFNHSNLRLPAALDQALRRLIVTPDMHRVHHSADRKEHNHNFGFNLSLWDRLFSSYEESPALGHEYMEIGIKGFQDKRSINLRKMLFQPIRKNED